MVIDQRNAGAEVNPAVSGSYYLDRWIVGSTVASKFKIGQKDAIDYYKVFVTDEKGTKELVNLVECFGYTEKEIEKMLT